LGWGFEVTFFGNDINLRMSPIRLPVLLNVGASAKLPVDGLDFDFEGDRDWAVSATAAADEVTWSVATCCFFAFEGDLRLVDSCFF
jgi:hypothetical protein